MDIRHMQLALLWACGTPGRVSFVQEVQKVLSSTECQNGPKIDKSHILRNVI